MGTLGEIGERLSEATKMAGEYKPIEILNQAFYYQINYEVSEAGDYEWAEFYIKGMKNELKWSWMKLRFVKTGKTVPDYKYVFQTFNIESDGYTKKNVKTQLEYQVELLGRKLEIQRGEIL